MSVRYSPEVNADTSERRLQLALLWREEWRRELMGKSSPCVPRLAPRDRGDFAKLITKAEFGRHYVDGHRQRQVLEQGAIVTTETGSVPETPQRRSRRAS